MNEKELVKHIKYRYGSTTRTALAESLNIGLQRLNNLVNKHGIKPAYQREYAVYRGDRYEMTGNRDDVMHFLDIKRPTFNYFVSPAYARRAEGGDWVRVIDVGLWRKDGNDNDDTGADTREREINVRYNS